MIIFARPKGNRSAGRKTTLGLKPTTLLRSTAAPGNLEGFFYSKIMLNWKMYNLGDHETHPKERLKQYAVKTSNGDFKFLWWDRLRGWAYMPNDYVEFYAEFNEPVKKVEFKKRPAPPAI